MTIPYPTLKHPLRRAVHVRISRDRMHLRHLETSEEATLLAHPPFTTPRLLVGGFAAAQKLLRRGIRDLIGSLGLAPVLVLSAVEMSEGGLSEAEEKLFLELGYGAGARHVIATSEDLSITQAREVLRGRSRFRT